MPRYCLLGRVDPGRLDEYRDAHRAVWPELLEALHDAGWRNYSLFLRDDGLLIGYAEADDLAVAQERVARTEVNARWQADMAPFFSQELSAGRHVRALPERGRSRRGLGDHPGGIQPRRSTPSSRMTDPATGRSRERHNE